MGDASESTPPVHCLDVLTVSLNRSLSLGSSSPARPARMDDRKTTPAASSEISPPRASSTPNGSENDAFRPNPFSSSAFAPQRSPSGLIFGQAGIPGFAREGSVTTGFRSSMFTPQTLATAISPPFPPRINAPYPTPLERSSFMGSAGGRGHYMTSAATSLLESHKRREEKDLNATRGYLQLLQAGSKGINGNGENEGRLGEIRTTPLFSQQVQQALRNGIISDLGSDEDPFPQFGLLGLREATYNSMYAGVPKTLPIADNLIFANMNAPWSTFICGSQGGGKSHSLSCLLENALLTTSSAGVNPRPLAGLVFHFDKFSNQGSTQVCEAAYLCSSGVPVRVLVSPSNYHAMNKLYRNLPGLPKDCPRPQVIPLRLSEQQLNVTRMMTLMAVQDNQQTPLYMEVLYKVLRDMSKENKGSSGLDYVDFKRRLGMQGFSTGQSRPLQLRLALLEEILLGRHQSAESAHIFDSVFHSAQGSLTIVDLSCPFVNENDACALFNICLSIFMENRADCGRVVALDEAHKFLTKSGEAEKLTEELISLIRQQRHLATRVIIATQEPTLSPSLLDLCNVSIVHRFNSPAWFTVLRDHLAGARLNSDSAVDALFEMIVGLKTGEALIFCPSALLDVDGSGAIDSLKDGFIKVQVRSRVTADGGKSIMASTADEIGVMETDAPVAEELLRPFTAPQRSAAPPRQLALPSGIDASAASVRFAAPEPANASGPPAASAQRKVSFRIPKSGKAASKAKRTPPTVGRAEKARIIELLQAEVTRAMIAKPKSHSLSEIRKAAASGSDLPYEFFCEKWTTPIIRDQAAKHAAAHGIPCRKFT